MDRRSQELREDLLVREVLVDLVLEREVVEVVDNTAWKLLRTLRPQRRLKEQ